MGNMEQLARQAMQKIANQKGITIFEVRREIERTIEEGIKSTDSEAKQLWNLIPRKNDIPTPEEFIVFVTTMLNK